MAVTIKTLPQIPSSPSAAEADHVNFPATYSATDIYVIETGNLFLPAAGPDGTRGRIVKTCARWGMHVVLWSATRIGKMPILPDYEQPDNPNEVLSSCVIGEPKADLLPDGKTHIFSATGKYEYWCLETPDKSKGFKIRVGPDDLTQPKSYDVSTKDFRDLAKW